jgi:hypothetical protein
VPSAFGGSWVILVNNAYRRSEFAGLHMSPAQISFCLPLALGGCDGGSP